MLQLLINCWYFSRHFLSFMMNAAHLHEFKEREKKSPLRVTCLIFFYPLLLLLIGCWRNMSFFFRNQMFQLRWVNNQRSISGLMDLDDISMLYKYVIGTSAESSSCCLCQGFATMSLCYIQYIMGENHTTRNIGLWFCYPSFSFRLKCLKMTGLTSRIFFSPVNHCLFIHCYLWVRPWGNLGWVWLRRWNESHHIHFVIMSFLQ